MKLLKPVVYMASLAIFGICLYLFLLGNGLLSGLFPSNTEAAQGVAVTNLGERFRNDPFSWYFLAKGIFCALSLYLSVTLIEAIHGLKAAILKNVQQPVTQTMQTPTATPTMAPITTATGSEKSWYQARQGVGQ